VPLALVRAVLGDRSAALGLPVEGLVLVGPHVLEHGPVALGLPVGGLVVVRPHVLEHGLVALGLPVGGLVVVGRVASATLVVEGRRYVVLGHRACYPAAGAVGTLTSM
jgi:hypothetical protein